MAQLSNWEPSKENIQPLKQGRNPSLLSAFGLQAKPVVHSMQEQKQIWENQIAECQSLHDPIDPWLKYIQWLQETVPQGGGPELVPLLERCARFFQSSEQYRNDIRYLRVWITYADCVAEPIDIFAFLRANRIGQELAVYYEALALVLEGRGRYSEADRAYDLGIRCNAHPVDVLRARYNSFQMRSLQRIQTLDEQETDEGATFNNNNNNNNNNRNALGTLSSRSAHSSFRPSAAFGGGLSAQNNNNTNTNTSTQAPHHISNPPARGNSQIPVFVDDKFRPEAGTANIETALSMIFDQNGPNNWTTLASQQEVHKENVDAPTPWTEARIPQQKKLMAPTSGAASSRIPVHIEEEFVHDINAAKSRTSAAAGSAAPNQRLAFERGSDCVQTQDLKKNPLQYFLDPSKAPPASNNNNTPTAASSMGPPASRGPSSSASSSSSSSSSHKLVAGPTPPSGETWAFNQDLLQNMTLSFEEVRAAEMMARPTTQQPQPLKVPPPAFQPQQQHPHDHHHPPQQQQHHLPPRAPLQAIPHIPTVHSSSSSSPSSPQRALSPRALRSFFPVFGTIPQ